MGRHGRKYIISIVGLVIVVVMGVSIISRR